MHFTIPYVEESLKSDGKKLHIYKIYLNGAHFCSARYSKFHTLYEEMKLNFEADELPYFPPKKMLKLTNTQVQERRDQLEYFVQRVSSSSQMNSSSFHKFLKTCQQESKQIVSEPVSLEVHLLDDTQFTVEVLTTSLTRTVLEDVARTLGLSHALTDKMGLFLVRIHGPGPQQGSSASKNQMSIIRQLQEFEYPCVSLRDMQERLQAGGTRCRIVLRKKTWRSDADEEIVATSPGLAVLYAQVCGELRYNWLRVRADDVRVDRLAALQERGARKELIQLVRSLPLYGFVRIFGMCSVTELSRPQLPVRDAVAVAAGHDELVLLGEDLNSIEERYSLTRIKTWKICTASQDELDRDLVGPSNGADNGRHGDDSGDDYDGGHRFGGGPRFAASLSFEYLDPSSRNLETVDIKNGHSDQIIFLSMCLKSMAEEFVQQRDPKASSPMSGPADENAGQSICASNNSLILGSQRSMYYCHNLLDDDL